MASYHHYFEASLKQKHPTRPYKCPKIYTSRILGEEILLQKERKVCQNLNRKKIMYLFKYTLAVQFSI